MSNSILFAFAEAVSKKSKFVNWKHCQGLMQTFTQTLHDALTKSIEVPSMEAFTKIMQDTIKTVYVDKIVSNKPKRPVSNFMAYCMEHRKQIHEEQPDLSSKEINALLGKMWHDLSQEEKDKYRAPKQESKATSKKAVSKKEDSKKADVKKADVKQGESEKADSRKAQKDTRKEMEAPTKKAQKQFNLMLRNWYKDEMILTHEKLTEQKIDVKCKYTSFPMRLPTTCHTFAELWQSISNEALTEIQIDIANDSNLFSEDVTTLKAHELWSSEVNQIQAKILDVINNWFHIRVKEESISKDDESMYHYLVSVGYTGETFDVIAEKYM